MCFAKLDRPPEGLQDTRMSRESERAARQPGGHRRMHDPASDDDGGPRMSTDGTKTLIAALALTAFAACGSTATLAPSSQAPSMRRTVADPRRSERVGFVRQAPRRQPTWFRQHRLPVQQRRRRLALRVRRRYRSRTSDVESMWRAAAWDIRSERRRHVPRSGLVSQCPVPWTNDRERHRRARRSPATRTTTTSDCF